LRVRQRAQFEFVRRRDESALTLAAREDNDPIARIHGLWGLGQLARAGRTVPAVVVDALADRDAEVRAQAAKVLGDVRAVTAAPLVLPLLTDAAARVRFFAAEALGRMKYAPALPGLVQMLAVNDDKDVYLRHAGSAAMAAIGDAGAIASLSQHPSRAVRLAAVIALRRLRDPAVAVFLADRDALVVTEAARAINDDGGIAAAIPALARLLDDTRFTGEALLRRAISANSRLGTSEAADRLTAFASRSASPGAMRAEALDALAVWTTPSVFDRVDGSYIGPR